MTALLSAEMVLIALAVVLAVWLKRAGEREWRRHRTRMVSVRIVADTARFTAAIAAMAPAMRRFTAAASDFERSMLGIQRAMNTPARKPDPEEPA